MKITEAVEVWNHHVEIPGTMKGHTVCTATHPDMPNHQGHSRGRKIHLMKTMEKTFCNMLVDKPAPADYSFFSMTENGTCKSCLKAVNK